MAAKMNVKKGDLVEVISGKDKGTRGHVLRALPSEEKVVVEGVAIMKKAQRPTPQNPQGGFITKEAPIHVSNVMLVCPECDKRTRIAHGEVEDGSKKRICKKCGAKF